MSTLTAPASAREALDMVRAGLGYLAAADPTQLDTQTQAQVLRELEQDDAVLTAARAWSLAAFTAGQGYCADADYSPRAWLMHQTGITRGAAAGHTAWARRADGHRLVVAALAAGQVSESYARAISQWTDKLPAESREAADEILLAAAGAGMGLQDLAGLAGELYQRSRPDLPDRGPGPGFRRPGRAAGYHVRRRRGDVGRPDPGVRGDRGRGRRTRCGACRGRGHPDPGAAVSRCAGGGDALIVKMHRDFHHISAASNYRPLSTLIADGLSDNTSPSTVVRLELRP